MKEENPFEKIFAEDPDYEQAEAQNINTNTDVKITAANLFPALNSNSSPPPAWPEPERDRQGFDRNNWSRLLRQAREMRPEIAEYLEILYQTGLRLKLSKKTGRFVFVAEGNKGGNKNNKNEERLGWNEERIKEIISALYTYMMYLPAWKELGQNGKVIHPVVEAMKAAITAGGLLIVAEKGLRFDWSGARNQDEVAEARRLLDGVGGQVMEYIRQAQQGIRDIGFCVTLAEMADSVNDEDWDGDGAEIREMAAGLFQEGAINQKREAHPDQIYC